MPSMVGGRLIRFCFRLMKNVHECSVIPENDFAHNRMHVLMAMDQVSECLHRGNHAGHNRCIAEECAHQILISWNPFTLM